MQNIKNVTEDIIYLGANDRRLSLFENTYPVPDGVSYNAYLIKDNYNVLLDTADRAVGEQFLENLVAALDGEKLDILVVNHMEPDHCSMISSLTQMYPGLKIIGNSKTIAMINQYFEFPVKPEFVTIKEGDSFKTDHHNLIFCMAPMVHWPEAMVTYDSETGVLFSADAFGTFGALSGSVFADSRDFCVDILPDARRYYTNIVGKYGNQVMALLNKASGLDIKMICPLHGPVWRNNINLLIQNYINWATYTPEKKGVLIVYGSIYGHTENACEILSYALDERGINDIKMFDVSVTHPSYILAECFKYSHIVFAASTYNSEIFTPMQLLLTELKEHSLQNRSFSIMENGSWAAQSGNKMQTILTEMKNMTQVGDIVTIKSAVKEETRDDIFKLADDIAAYIGEESAQAESSSIDKNAMFKLSYGLYALFTNDGKKDNACIINTVTQITDTPKRIMIAVNNDNYSCETLKANGKFNISILNQAAPFALFKQFGFQSGRDNDKLKGMEGLATAKNGIPYLTENTNAFISAQVVEEKNYGTHTVFIAEVTEAEVLNATESITYEYYFANTKPKPQVSSETKKGFVCKVCGYIYEGDTLPADFICPWCKHGVEDFEPINQ